MILHDSGNLDNLLGSSDSENYSTLDSESSACAPDVTMKTASLAYVGGYIVRTILDNTDCVDCHQLLSQPQCDSPLMGLISHQNRGQLRYPNSDLIHILVQLQNFLLEARKHIPTRGTLEWLKEILVPKLSLCPALKCSSGDETHPPKLSALICEKFLKPVLCNFADNITEMEEIILNLNHKPLGRKVYRL